MARSRSPNREKAFQIYKENKGNITSQQIADILNESVKNIQFWRSADSWSKKYNPKGGAPLGNTNADGAPCKNQYARKHGFYSKLMPAETYDIFTEVEDMSPLEILWTNIKIKYAAILRAQKIMFVKDRDDMTKELKKTKISDSDEFSNQEYEYDIQYAWDKQANFLQAQSKAMSTLTNMIKKYDEMLHANWESATEEQKLRIERLKQRIENKEFEHRKEVDNKKLELERERFEHNKKMDELKVW